MINGDRCFCHQRSRHTITSKEVVSKIISSSAGALKTANVVCTKVGASSIVSLTLIDVCTEGRIEPKSLY